MTTERRDFAFDGDNTLLDGGINLGWDVAVHFSLELSAPAGLVDESGRFTPSADTERP